MKNHHSKLKKEQKKKRFFVEAILIVIFSSILLFSGYQLGYNHTNILSSISVRSYSEASEINISQDCSNLDLRTTADCLVQHIRPFYKYTITPQSKVMNLTELKENGGDCKDWSALYNRLIQSIPNYYGRLVYIDSTATTAHQYTVLSNGEGYCVLDEANYVCFSFNGGA